VFNHLNFYKIMGRTTEENLATIRLFDIFGFKLEGQLKKHMLVDGDRLDVVQYSLMKPQFSREIGDKLKSVLERVESAA
jgi:Acetyltransferases, including N-acetylases of ribosomal proteins